MNTTTAAQRHNARQDKIWQKCLELQKPLKDAFIRRYSDNGQVKAIIIHATGVSTEGDIMNGHMTALLQRAMREGLTIRQEAW